ncbi:MAG TPA: LytTR family DNA-binding domain-containing protein [Bryobacteraceae bacterium]|nr:LytTR family DNA-binding domain-containing protein [Bryobacteraceae bacterium]
MRALIIDDEELPRQLLREYCSSEPDLEIVGELADGFAAVKACADLHPDLLFLDVQMPKLDGFEVLELLESGPAVIFTTAYDHFALRAFEVHAVDYLLKPFTLERFRQAVSRARQRVGGNGAPPPAASLNLAAHGRENPLRRLVVRDGAKISLVPVADILALEAQDDYVALHTAAKTYLKKQTLASLEAALDPAQFPRVHRGWLLNLSALVRLEPYSRDSYVAVLTGGRRIPVSRAGQARLRELLG